MPPLGTVKEPVRPTLTSPTETAISMHKPSPAHGMPLTTADTDGGRRTLLNELLLSGCHHPR
ncbi:hypothetical protein M407DRAFT_242897 [Tulasnella calospora MUT 4182]|uniref:Uncharacterized protein n=1 Tax=Tulasnella calospora MUT 4182 TaxID=1051891 RepID=A0A0C3QNJ1_9AGAM|nr:hypothetical protein M407DRAFT_242897 [Tulasnella calospora MUT 4182]